MKRLILILTAVLIFLLPVRGELAVNVGGIYSGAFTIDNFNLTTTFTDSLDIVSFRETNYSEFIGSSGFGLNTGISVFFNYKLGVGINASFMKTTFDINNSFDWNWEWWDGTTGNITPKNWENTGSVSTIPISLNIIYRIVSNEQFKVNLFAGPTMYLTSVELDGNGGYADGPILYSGSYYIDWYDFPLESSVSETVFGGNGGIELEYMFSESMNLYFAATYYFAGDLNLNWMVKPGQYTGEFGSLIGEVSNSGILPGYTIPIKLSTYTLGFGIKIYL